TESGSKRLGSQTSPDRNPFQYFSVNFRSEGSFCHAVATKPESCGTAGQVLGRRGTGPAPSPQDPVTPRRISLTGRNLRIYAPSKRCGAPIRNALHKPLNAKSARCC